MTHQRFQELVALTQRFLIEEYSPGSQLFCDADSFDVYYRKELRAPLLSRIATPQKTEQIENLIVKASPPTKSVCPPPQPQKAPPPKETTKCCSLEEKPAEMAPPESTKAPLEGRASPRRSFEREPMEAAPPHNFTTLFDTIKKIAPQHTIHETPPSDAKVQQRSTTQPEVVVLAFNEEAATRAFLSNLTVAVRLQLAPAALYSAPRIEGQNSWNALFNQKQLRLIICSDYNMYTFPLLMQHYRRSSTGKQHYMGGVPTLLLSDINLYLQQPTLKGPLWQALKAMV